MTKEYADLAEIIIGLKNADIELRDQLIQNGKLSGGYNSTMARLHNKNAQILNEIIDKIGYPTTEKVGKLAHEAAWMVIQHAIGQPVFMKKCAKLLEELHDDREHKIYLAYLTDRIAVFENRPQLYGTLNLIGTKMGH
jgi:hypothetical protein